MRLLEYLHKRQANGHVSWPRKLHTCPAPVEPVNATRAITPGSRSIKCRNTPQPPAGAVPAESARYGAGLLLYMPFFLTLFGLFILGSLLFPAEALAWGPGVHMTAGNWVLQNLSALPAAIAEALISYPGQYLHGGLAADIFIGKGSKAKSGHSHNWDSGFRLLDKADNQRRLAYALGYLSHLAADTVAHNVYVPGTFATAPGPGRLAHVYIEWHADASLNWDAADARGVFHEAGSLASERILRDTVRQKAWKYWLKKHLYERSISFGNSRTMLRSINMMDRLFPGEDRLRLLDYMLTLSTRAIYSVLGDLDASPVFSLDPIGADALSLAVSRRSGRGLIIGSVKNIIHKPSRPVPDMSFAAPVPAHPEISIVVPELMSGLPRVCTPESFVIRKGETSKGDTPKCKI